MAPEGLSERGLALWNALTDAKTWDPAGLILIAEACRLADRLEKLDKLLRHDIEAWARIVDDYSSGHRDVVLEIDDALGEARQQQGSLLQILTKLGLGKSEPKPAGKSSLDDIAARRAARIAKAQAG